MYKESQSQLLSAEDELANMKQYLNEVLKEVGSMRSKSNWCTRLNYKQIILDCQIRRLTDKETLEYFQIHDINDISLPTIKRYKSQIRRSAQKWISALARSKRAEYIAEYRERIDEILKCQKELWNIYNDKNTKSPVKVMALSKIMDATMKLTELYDALPIIAAIRNYDNVLQWL